jgi:hypothetical protein
MSTLTQQEQAREARQERLSFYAFIVVVLVIAAIGVWQFTRPEATASPGATDAPDTPQALWQSQDINNYRFDLVVGCFCLREMTRPVTIEVKDGEVASITYIDDGESADPMFFDGFATIDQLFERLADKEAQDPVKFDVVYDEALGIPLSANIDVSELMMDEELSLTVSNFESLQ